MLVRILRPTVVIETGVANGISSAFILKALDKNNEGMLYSIDLHYRNGVLYHKVNNSVRLFQKSLGIGGT